jgi:hypothetical protein
MTDRKWQNSTINLNPAKQEIAAASEVTKLFSYLTEISKLQQSIEQTFSDLGNYFDDNLQELQQQYDQLMAARNKISGLAGKIISTIEFSVNGEPHRILLRDSEFIFNRNIMEKLYYYNYNGNEFTIVPNTIGHWNLQEKARLNIIQILQEFPTNDALDFNNPKSEINKLKWMRDYKANIQAFHNQYETVLGIDTRTKADNASQPDLDTINKLANYFGTFHWESKNNTTEPVNITNYVPAQTAADMATINDLFGNILKRDLVSNTAIIDSIHEHIQYFVNAMVTNAKATCFAKVADKQQEFAICVKNSLNTPLNKMNNTSCDHLIQPATNAADYCNNIFPMQSNFDGKTDEYMLNSLKINASGNTKNLIDMVYSFYGLKTPQDTTNESTTLIKLPNTTTNVMGMVTLTLEDANQTANDKNFITLDALPNTTTNVMGTVTLTLEDTNQTV